MAERSTKRARRRGSGGVFAVRDGVWRVDVEIARDPVSGHRRRVSRTIHGTREEAELALARLKVADHEKRLPTGGTNARSVAAVFQLYRQAIDAGLIELAPSTVATVRSATKVMAAVHLPDGREFGSIRLSRLTRQDIEYLYGAMRAAGKSPACVRRCATVLARALDLARKRGLIDSNPAKDATRPRTSRSKPFAPTAAEVRDVLAEAQRRDPEIGDAATILASTGMRRGEFIALRWGDVKLDQSELHIAAAISDGGPGNGLVYKATKKSDWRDVPSRPPPLPHSSGKPSAGRNYSGERRTRRSTPSPAASTATCRCARIRSRTGGRRRAARHQSRCSTSATTQRRRCSTLVSRTALLRTSSATARQRCGCTTTAVLTSASARR